MKPERRSSYLLPVFLQGRHGGEIAGVVDELELLEDAVVGQNVHDDAPDDANASRQKSGGEISSQPRGDIQHHFTPLPYNKHSDAQGGRCVIIIFIIINIQ